jgi:hypothetical protein
MDGGWKSPTVAEGDIENSLENKKETPRKIFGLGNQLQAQPSTSQTYRSTRTAWRATQWTEIPPTSGAHLSVIHM